MRTCGIEFVDWVMDTLETGCTVRASSISKDKDSIPDFTGEIFVQLSL